MASMFGSKKKGILVLKGQWFPSLSSLNSLTKCCSKVTVAVNGSAS